MIIINAPITESSITTATAVIALHCQLLFNIFVIAHMAVIGAFIPSKVCRDPVWAEKLGVEHTKGIA